MRSLRSAVFSTFSAALLLSLGCGTSTAPALGDYVDVTGTVTVSGTPLKSGAIHFKPEAAGGREEVAAVADGKFSQKMFTGKYKVAFDLEQTRSSVSAKYRSYTTADQSAEVKSSGNELRFELK